MQTMKELSDLWVQLGDIPVNENDELDEPFLHFPKGTDKMEVWHWFESQNPQFIIGKLRC